MLCLRHGEAQMFSCIALMCVIRIMEWDLNVLRARKNTDVNIKKKKKHPSLQAKPRKLPALLPLCIKFADDTALVSLLQGKEDNHRLVLGQFTLCCNASDLLLKLLRPNICGYIFREKN